MVEEFKDPVSTFNMAVATLMRIDTLLSFINKLMILRRHPVIMRNALESLYKEVYPFLDADERKEGLGMFMRISHSVARKDAETVSFTSDAFDLMFNFDLWLRDKLNEKGLLIARGDDDDGI